jgi:hypothetical protein
VRLDAALGHRARVWHCGERRLVDLCVFSAIGQWLRRRRLAARKPLLYRSGGAWVCQWRGARTTPQPSPVDAWFWMRYS